MNKRGILSKKNGKAYEPDQTQFKLCVYYAQKPNGEYYSNLELQSDKNRKYHDSIDFVQTHRGEYETRHDIAFNKLLRHVDRYKDRIICALLYVNDRIHDEQLLIGKFFQDEDKTQLIVPKFSPEGKFNGIFYEGLPKPAIETYELKY